MLWRLKSYYPLSPFLNVHFVISDDNMLAAKKDDEVFFCLLFGYLLLRLFFITLLGGVGASVVLV